MMAGKVLRDSQTLPSSSQLNPLRSPKDTTQGKNIKRKRLQNMLCLNLLSNSQFGVYKGPKHSKNAQTENCCNLLEKINFFSDATQGLGWVFAIFFFIQCGKSARVLITDFKSDFQN